jgi:dolichol-phosphate mannosyltransferase
MAESVLVILPTYNERDNLEPIAAAVRAQLPTAQLLIIDDGSPDGTGAIADGLAAADRRVTVVHRSGKLGLGTAYLLGFRHAIAEGVDFVFEMDSDFSHDPRALPELLAAARAGADLAIGSRWVAGGGTVNWGLQRRLLSRGGSLYARAILGVGVRDLTSGFKCFRRTTLERLDLDRIRSEGYSFQIEMTYRVLQAGMRVAEVPITFVDRRVGQSKMSKAIFLEAVAMVWKLRLGLVEVLVVVLVEVVVIVEIVVVLVEVVLVVLVEVVEILVQPLVLVEALFLVQIVVVVIVLVGLVGETRRELERGRQWEFFVGVLEH